MTNNMTVRELIEILRQYDENEEVSLYTGGGEWSEAILSVGTDDIMEAMG